MHCIRIGPCAMHPIYPGLAPAQRADNCRVHLARRKPEHLAARYCHSSSTTVRQRRLDAEESPIATCSTDGRSSQQLRYFAKKREEATHGAPLPDASTHHFECKPFATLRRNAFVTLWLISISCRSSCALATLLRRSCMLINPTYI